MAERRTDASTGAPGSTGAYKTTDPLGAPGSTGAGQTKRDPTAVPAPAAAVYEEPTFDYGIGGQQQPHRHPTSGHQEHADPLSGIGGQQQQHRHPTSGHQELGDPLTGIGYSSGGQQQHRHPTSGQQEFGDPRSGIGGGQQHHHLNPTAAVGYGGGDPASGIGYGDRSQQKELRDPTSGVGFKDTGKFEPREGDKAVSTGVTGYTRVTTATAPVEGGGVVYGHETATTTAEDLGAAGTGREEKGVAEKVKDKIKDAVGGCGGGHHSR